MPGLFLGPAHQGPACPNREAAVLCRWSTGHLDFASDAARKKYSRMVHRYNTHDGEAPELTPGFLAKKHIYNIWFVQHIHIHTYIYTPD